MHKLIQPGREVYSLEFSRGSDSLVVKVAYEVICCIDCLVNDSHAVARGQWPELGDFVHLSRSMTWGFGGVMPTWEVDQEMAKFTIPIPKYHWLDEGRDRFDALTPARINSSLAVLFHALGHYRGPFERDESQLLDINMATKPGLSYLDIGLSPDTLYWIGQIDWGQTEVADVMQQAYQATYDETLPLNCFRAAKRDDGFQLWLPGNMEPTIYTCRKGRETLIESKDLDNASLFCFLCALGEIHHLIRQITSLLS